MKLSNVLLIIIAIVLVYIAYQYFFKKEKPAALNIPRNQLTPPTTVLEDTTVSTPTQTSNERIFIANCNSSEYNTITEENENYVEKTKAALAIALSNFEANKTVANRYEVEEKKNDLSYAIRIYRNHWMKCNSIETSKY